MMKTFMMALMLVIKLPNRVIGIINIRFFSKLYRRHHESVFGLKSLIHHGLSEPEFYGDLVYKKIQKDMGRTDFFLISFEK